MTLIGPVLKMMMETRNSDKIFYHCVNNQIWQWFGPLHHCNPCAFLLSRGQALGLHILGPTPHPPGREGFLVDGWIGGTKVGLEGLISPPHPPAGDQRCPGSG